MNTNTTSYIPQTYWTIILIIFYGAKTVYKKSLVQNSYTEDNFYLQNPIEHTDSLFTQSLYFIEKSILYMGAGITSAIDYFNWSEREACKDYVAKVLGGNFTTINAAEFCNKHNSHIPTSLKSALEILKDSNNPLLALKFRDHSSVEALKILKDINPELALKSNYNENVVFLNSHNDLFEKCNVEESGYNEDCMDDIMRHSNDTVNDLLEYAKNIDIAQYQEM